MRASAKQLGDAGERQAVKLLEKRGFLANTLPTNFPTYDVKASRNGVTFFISVKVSRNKQHVRLGSRNSVSRLTSGNFVFAFLPQDGLEIADLELNQYRLLILPAAMVRDDSLRVHDAYWAERGHGDQYSVMVKGYGRHHRDIWPRWLGYADAWQQLP